MCLLTRQDKPIILREDKLVWKILTDNNDRANSIWCIYQYILGEINQTEIDLSIDVNAFDEPQRIKYLNEDYKLLDGVKSIGSGFHSFTNIEECNRSFNRFTKYSSLPYKIYECIIPAGSEYYEDETYLCVSNNIIIKNKIS